MGIKIKVKINPWPCKHSVVTVTEDEVDTVTVFHDFDFEDDSYTPDVDWKEVHKAIKKRLDKTGKKFSESKNDFHNKFLKQSIEDEDEQ